jgi:hypothetical protein
MKDLAGVFSWGLNRKRNDEQEEKHLPHFIPRNKT